MSRSPKHRTFAVASLLATTAVLAVAAPSAVAATVTYNVGGTSPGMNATDDPGNAADLVVTSGTLNNHIGLRSNSAALTAGSGCTQVSATEVTCFRGSGPNIATINLGDGDDRLGSVFNGAALFIRAGDGNDTVTGSDGGDALDGDAGNDSLQGAFGNDVLNGGPGNDRFLNNHRDDGNDVKNGGDGNDRIEFLSTGDPGNDVYTGGAGVDVLDFSGSDLGVSISLDDIANDGPAGHADNAASDIENIRGSRGNDTLIGDSGRNLLEGLAGGDVLRGGTPARVVRVTFGLVGDDTLDGGIGLDRMDGEGGDDLLLARDAIDDQLSVAMNCGSGDDRLIADLADDDTRALSPSCESIDQGAINEGANVTIASRRLGVSPGGTVRARLRCPRSVGIGCRGTLAAGAPKRAGLRGLGRRTRYRIRRGRSKLVTIRVPAALERAANRRRRPVPARVVSVETGEHGDKTTVRRVGLR
jgi:Ca2+-binding RTX toxin-like protein